MKPTDSETLSGKQLRYRLFFETLIRRASNMTSWDVLNEVVADRAPFGQQRPMIKDHTLSEPDHLSFLAFCLNTARALAGPSVRLVLNDYNLYCPGRICEGKRTNVLAAVRALLDHGAPHRL